MANKKNRLGRSTNLTEADITAYYASKKPIQHDLYASTVLLVVGHGNVGKMYTPSPRSRELIFMDRVNSGMTTAEDSINLLNNLVKNKSVSGLKKLNDITTGNHPFYVEITKETLHDTEGRVINQGIYAISASGVRFAPLKLGRYSLNELTKYSDGEPIIISACPEDAFNRSGFGIMNIPQTRIIIGQQGGGSERLYAVKEAYYTQEDDPDRGRAIAGIPPYGFKYFGEYTGSPSNASKKAFTGLQKHMKKYHKDSDWFPGYDPSAPPKITFMMVDVTDPDTPMWYEGRRIPAHQGNRVIKNRDGRIRNYKWDSKVIKVMN